MSTMQGVPKSALLPETAGVNGKDHLVVGGCDVVDLAAEFGTPLYVFDEVALRSKCAEFKAEFGSRYPDTMVIYACKAFINQALALIFKEEGLGLDVVSAGELAIARSVAFPMEKVYFHGNNKTPDELRLALEWGVGRVVVDNMSELSMLNGLAQEAGRRQDILLRLSPGIDPHTHAYTTTGIIDSKFGLPIVSGQAEEALMQAMAASNLNLVGLHVHLGSPIYDVEPYEEAIRVVLGFAAGMTVKHGFELREFNMGGGFAIQYTLEAPAPAISEYAEAIVFALVKVAERLGLPVPRLVVEPGRSIVGRAGLAIYTVGAIKDIPGVRKYVSVDGGMADNIRPALYGATYEAVVANKMAETSTERVTISGKFCESGDILIKDVELPALEASDLVVILAAGAYCLAMASNYNAALKPPIVLVKQGKARLIRRRETYEDLMRCDSV